MHSVPRHRQYNYPCDRHYRLTEATSTVYDYFTGSLVDHKAIMLTCMVYIETEGFTFQVECSSTGNIQP